MPDDLPPPSPPNLGDFFSKQSQPENGWRAVKYYRDPRTPKIVQWVMRLSGGRVRDTRQAVYVLLGLVVAMSIIAVIVAVGGRGTSKMEIPPGYNLIQGPGQPPKLDRPYR